MHTGAHTNMQSVIKINSIKSDQI